jgi:hypothetical protein
MIIAFPRDVLSRLDHIERQEGTPAIEVVHQAVAVWSYMTADERRRLGQVAIGLVAQRILKGGHQ